MTLLVGILCSDGVVIASDSDATFGTGQASTIGQMPVQKVYKLADTAIFAATGAVGISQIIADRLSQGMRGNEFRAAASPEQLMHLLGTQINKIVTPYLESGAHVQRIVGNANGSLCKSMIAIECKGIPCLFHFDFNGAPERATKDLPFVALGSGQQIADPFLAFLKRLIWSDVQPTTAEGKLVGVWTTDHVCATNAGGVGGAVQAMVLTKGARIVELDETITQEHRQLIAGAERSIVAFLRSPATSVAPPIPTPPAP